MAVGNSIPEEAGRAWWEAMQAGDIPALARMTLDDHVSVGGPGGRALGRDALLAEATDFLTRAEIDDWTVTDVLVLRDGQWLHQAHHVSMR